MRNSEPKTFDCIEHKRRVQKKLLEEYEARKVESASQADFVYAMANESEQIRAWRDGIEKAKDAAGS